MSQKYCGKCGKSLEDEWISCPYCGRVIGAQASPFQQIQTTYIVKIKEILNEYIWIFPLVGGVLTFIALLTPVAYFEGEFFGFPVKWYLWMWGFGYGRNGFGIIRDDEFRLFSFSISTVFLISSIVLIYIAYRMKTYEVTTKFLNILVYIIGISQVILLIGWMVVFETFFTGIWAIVDVGFGITGIFISAALSIISGIIIRTLKIEIPKKEKKTKEKQKKKKRKDRLKMLEYVLLISIFLLVLLLIYVIFNIYL